METVESKRLDRTLIIFKQDIQKANAMINALKREARIIDDFTFAKENEIHNDNVAAKVQTQPKKDTSFLKKVAGVVVFVVTFGTYAPAVDAQTGVGYDDKSATVVSKPMGGMVGVDGKEGVIGYSMGDGVVGTRNGKAIITPKYELGEGATKLMQEKANSEQYKSQTKPKNNFNYATAKQVQDAINDAYHKHEYQKMRESSDYGLNNKDKLKVTPKQIEELKHCKKLGEYYIKTNN